MVYEENPMNADVSRELSPAVCVVLSGRLEAKGDGSLLVRSWEGNNAATWQYVFDIAGMEEGDSLFELEINADSIRVSTTSPRGIVREDRTDSESTKLPGERRYALGVRNLLATVSDLKVQIRPRIPVGYGGKRSTSTEFVLGANEYYLLGDNTPISIDSRHWTRLIRRQDIMGLVRKNQ